MAQSMAEVLIDQGETRAKRELLLKLLQFRFETVPELVITRITAIQDRS